MPYLTFHGNAAAALKFYSKALGGEVVYQQTYGDAPMDCPPEQKDKIMHATFKAGDLTLMVSDASHGKEPSGGTNLSLSINFTDEESIEKTFAALSEGATIGMPLENTFWGAKFGMLTDQFGFHWMFNHDLKKDDNK